MTMHLKRHHPGVPMTGPKTQQQQQLLTAAFKHSLQQNQNGLKWLPNLSGFLSLQTWGHTPLCQTMGLKICWKSHATQSPHTPTSAWRSCQNFTNRKKAKLLRTYLMHPVLSSPQTGGHQGLRKATWLWLLTTSQRSGRCEVRCYRHAQVTQAQI